MARGHLGIEEKIEKLMEFMRAVHNRFDMHEWVRDFRPWNTDRDESTFWIKCHCGENREARNEVEYNAAEQEYDGY